MRVLITNYSVAQPSGTERFVVDLARGLLGRGHTPIVYSPRLAELAAELRELAVPVVADLDQLAEAPDILHLQHHPEAVTALARFPAAPAVFACHGFRPWLETPVHHPSIRLYVGVDEATRDRLHIEHGILDERIRLIPNAVDLLRFRPRGQLPLSPRRALALSNELGEANGLGVLRAACAARGIELEAAGIASGRPMPDPERRLAGFDLVFGHGRVALEALAVGAAVVVCGAEGLGPMVSAANFEALRRRNFGVRTQPDPIEPGAVLARIDAYDPEDTAAVSRRVRQEAGLEEALDRWLAVYEEAIAAGAADRGDPEAAGRAFASYLRWLSLYIAPRIPPQAEEGRAATAERDRLRAELALAHAEREALSARVEELAGFQGELLRSSGWRLLESARGLFGRRWQAPANGAHGPRPRLLALLVFRDEIEFLHGWLENVPPEVDGVVALDDGSVDGSAELVASHPSVIELIRQPRRPSEQWDDGANHRRLIEAALRHRPDWLLGVDADERLESGFGERARTLIRNADAAGIGAFYVTIRELWDAPDRYRADGIWGAKRSARLFRARQDHEFDSQRLHGHWAPLNSRVGGDFLQADLIVYHLRMLTPERRRRRRERYETLDPDRLCQEIGYAYLTDETGLELAPLPAGRGYRPLGS
jgi:hypothetical protein